MRCNDTIANCVVKNLVFGDAVTIVSIRQDGKKTQLGISYAG